MIIKNNNIKCDYINIYDLQPEKICIPIFQRFYAWKDKEIIRFKEDLLEVICNIENQFYLLDFIYYEEKGKYMIADGQQRIVTLNNLIKAIKYYVKKNSITIEEIDLFDISYDIPSNNKKYQTHINNYETNPFKNVYLSFLEFIESNESKIHDIIYVIKNKIHIYLKKAENADDAFNIFQQINTGGKALTKDEVIKTALDQYAEAYQLKIDTSNKKELRQSLISFYKYKLSDFDKNFKNIEIITFLRDYVTKNKETFQDFVDTINVLDKIGDTPLKYIIEYINRHTIMDVLNILAMKRIDINKSNEYLTKVFLPLCMMSINLTLNGGSPTTYRYLLNDIVKDIKEEKKPEDINSKLVKKINLDSLTWKISINDFTTKLGDKKVSQKIKKALLIIDVICKNTSGTLNVDKINLEHIYPKNPSHDWAANGWPANSEDHKELVDNIGNYVLLSENVNKSIQNQYITSKIPRYEEIIKKDILLQTPINTVDFSQFENQRDNYIKTRQKFICETIQKELPLGKVLITDN